METKSPKAGKQVALVQTKLCTERIRVERATSAQDSDEDEDNIKPAPVRPRVYHLCSDSDVESDDQS